MTTNYNARIVSSGLVLNLDASNARSLSNVSANLITIPENLSNAVWGKNAIDASFTSVLAPDGSQTVYSLAEQANSAQHLLIYSIGTVVINDTFTWSGHFKNNTNTTQIVLHTNGEGTVTFNISGATAGTVAGTGGANTLSSSIVSLGNGWYRCAATFRKANTVGTFYVSNQNGLGVYVGNTSISYYAWGLQLELGSTVTPYYPVSRPVTTTWNDLSGTNNHATLLPNTLSSVEVLVVAGGGAGGCGEGNLNGDGGAGGGGGGVIYNVNFPVTSETNYTVTVGDGGAGNAVSGVPGASGNNSIFGSLTAFGGGGGGGGDYTGSSMPGGSGGGASREGGTNKSGGIALAQGFVGGSALDVRRGAAGGGGAGGAGLNTIDTGAGGIGPGSNGGPGAAYNISGTVSYYGGGGGGAPSLNFSSGTSYGGIGGIGGGGSILPNGGPGAISQPGSSGTANTGGGGAGGYGISGGNGGSGIVIVRYPGYQKATGGTIAYDGVYTTHTFTSVGSTTFQLATSASPQYTTLKGGALTFNGSTHHLTAPNSTSLCLTNDLTINVWMYTTGATAIGLGLVAKGPESGDYDYMLYLTSSSTVVNFYKKNSASIAESSNGMTSTFIRNWVNVCYTLSGVTCVGYINGVLTENKTFTNAGIRVTNNPLRIGHAWGNVYYTGYLPVVQIYNRALTAVEVLNNFNALRGRYAV